MGLFLSIKRDSDGYEGRRTGETREHLLVAAKIIQDFLDDFNWEIGRAHV